MGVVPEEWWWWGAVSSAQIAAGFMSVRRGYAGNETMMPLKAFVVATLFVGGGATGALAALQANGLRDLEDWKQVGAGIRRLLRAPPRKKGAGGDELATEITRSEPLPVAQAQSS